MARGQFPINVCWICKGYKNLETEEVITNPNSNATTIIKTYRCDSCNRVNTVRADRNDTQMQLFAF